MALFQEEMSVLKTNNYTLKTNHASYADQELFCRWKQDGILGDASKDWSSGGAQSPYIPRN